MNELRSSNEIVKILKIKMKDLNLNQKELAKKTGVSTSAISRYFKGSREFPINDAPIFAKALNIDLNFLLGIKSTNEKFHDSDSTDIDTENKKHIPTTSMLFYNNICVDCSNPILPEYSQAVEVKEIELPDAILGDIAGKSNLIAIKSRGDSMDKIIPEGSLVIIQKLLPFENVQNGDIVMYSYEDSWSIKEFIKEDDCVIFRPHSNNPHHKDNIYKFSDMEDGLPVPEIIGKVVYYGVSL